MADKLTPEEIKKALECCVNGKCFKCPLKTMNCSAKVPMAFALDLINRQQAEIERLQSILVRFLDEMSEWGNKNNVDTTNFSIIPIAESEKESLVKQLKSEAIKEFIEKLKEKKHIAIPFDGYPVDEDDWAIYKEDIDETYKEMVGEDK